MIKVDIAGMIRTEDGWRITLLDRAGRRALPVGVWGSAVYDIEASLNDWQFMLPYTYEFVIEAFDLAGVTVESVDAYAFDEDLMQTHAKVRTNGKAHAIGIRPNEGIALALRAGCPVMVADEIMDQLAAPLPGDATIDDKPGAMLSDEVQAALVAMVDKKLRFRADKVVDGIYITGARRRPSEDVLRAENITRVLQLYYNDVPWPDGVEVFDNSLDDGAHVPTERIQRGVEWVHAQREAGHNVAISCWEGISRSSTFVLAYMVEGLGYDLRDAWRVLKRKHLKAWPARQMWESLLARYKPPYTIKDVYTWLDEA
jgi:bifunctional DNase/RNase